MCISSGKDKDDIEMLWSMLRDLGVRDDRVWSGVESLIPKVAIE